MIVNRRKRITADDIYVSGLCRHVPQRLIRKFEFYYEFLSFVISCILKCSFAMKIVLVVLLVTKFWNIWDSYLHICYIHTTTYYSIEYNMCFIQYVNTIWYVKECETLAGMADSETQEYSVDAWGSWSAQTLKHRAAKVEYQRATETSGCRGPNIKGPQLWRFLPGALTAPGVGRRTVEVHQGLKQIGGLRQKMQADGKKGPKLNSLETSSRRDWMAGSWVNQRPTGWLQAKCEWRRLALALEAFNSPIAVSLSSLGFLTV